MNPEPNDAPKQTPSSTTPEEQPPPFKILLKWVPLRGKPKDKFDDCGRVSLSGVIRYVKEQQAACSKRLKRLATLN